MYIYYIYMRYKYISIYAISSTQLQLDEQDFNSRHS